MNKKVVIGCLAGLIIVAVAAGIVLYFYVIRPAGEYISGIKEISQVAELDQDIRNREAFSPPEDGLLTREQVERFIRVHQHIETSLGGRGDQLKSKYESLSQGGDPGLGEILEMLKDLGGMIREAKQYQVEAINQENFSKEEYQWVKKQVLQALGSNTLSLNLGRIAEAIQSQNPDILTEKPEMVSVPDANRELVQEHEKELLKSLDFVWLGL